MRTVSGIAKGLFEGVTIGDAEKELLELTKMSDDDLQRKIGLVGRETLSTMRPSSDYMKSPNVGDNTGRSPFFFFNEKVEIPGPAVYFDLPSEDLEAGRLLCGQIGAHFDRIICETATSSPLYGYKQEAIKLGNRCVEAICGRYPMIDRKIVMAFVAMRTKELFNVCTMW